MEAYTSMKMTVEDITKIKEVANLFKETLQIKANNTFAEKYIPKFCNDMHIKGSEIIVDYSCSISSEELEYFKEVLIAVAKATDCEFTCEVNHEHCNCGFEEYIEAEYKNGVLTYKDMASEDMSGCCSDEDCGEWIVHALDYDPSKTYTCPECGRVVSEEELFPYGVPTWEVEEIRIK